MCTERGENVKIATMIPLNKEWEEAALSIVTSARVSSGGKTSSTQGEGRGEQSCRFISSSSGSGPERRTEDSAASLTP